MFVNLAELESRVRQYADLHDVTINFETKLGWGTDGAVWRTDADRHTAVKVFDRERTYLAELSCYLRLREHAIDRIDGCAVPTIREFNDHLKVIEIGIVSPPYILDFGKTYLDFEPEHSPETLEDWENEQKDRWEERWPEVQSIFWQLEKIGIYYTDPNCDNIRLPPRKLP